MKIKEETIIKSYDEKYWSGMGDDNKAYSSEDMGKTWVEIKEKRWCSCHVSEGGSYLLVTTLEGEIKSSSDYGKTWVDGGGEYTEEDLKPKEKYIPKKEYKKGVYRLNEVEGDSIDIIIFDSEKWWMCGWECGMDINDFDNSFNVAEDNIGELLYEYKEK